MKRLADQNRARIGLIGIAVIAFLAALVGAASTLSIGKHSYTAVLEHTGGLRVGEEVQVAGVGVGEVTGIELADRQVRVEFTLDDALTLGEDTRAEVKVATLLGTHYLLVVPSGTGSLGEDTIPLAQTRVPFNLQDVLDVGVPEIRQFDAKAIERSLAELATTLDASGDDLGPALDGVQELSGLIALRSDDIADLLTATRRVTRQLTASGGDLIEMMAAADVILDTLRTRRETIHELLVDLTRFGRELSSTIEQTEGDLRPVLENLDVVIEVLKEHDESLDDALQVLAPASRYFANAGGEGPWLSQFTDGATPDGINCIEKRNCK